MNNKITNENTHELTTGYRIRLFFGQFMLYGILVIWGIIAIIPFLWMLSTSVMTLGEAISGDVVTSNKLLERFIYSDDKLDILLGDQSPDFLYKFDQITPSEEKMSAREYIDANTAYVIFDSFSKDGEYWVFRGGLINYITAWEQADFSEYLINSIQITFITLTGELLISILAAYAFARMKFPGKNLIFGILLSTMMIPGMVTLIPNFITITWLGRTTDTIMGMAVWFLLLFGGVALFLFSFRRTLSYLLEYDLNTKVIINLVITLLLNLLSLGAAALAGLQLIYNKRLVIPEQGDPAGFILTNADILPNFLMIAGALVLIGMLSYQGKLVFKELKKSPVIVIGAVIIFGLLYFQVSGQVAPRISGLIDSQPWFDNWPALTIPFMGSVFSIFLLRQFFAQIPDELFDAAQIDGANHWQFLWQVAFPLTQAPVLVIIVLSFIGTWNALAWPILVTSTPEWRPIAVGLFRFVDDQAGSLIHLQMAGAVITIIPILILYFITQRQFTESIARTGLKS